MDSENSKVLCGKCANDETKACIAWSDKGSYRRDLLNDKESESYNDKCKFNPKTCGFTYKMTKNNIHKMLGLEI